MYGQLRAGSDKGCSGPERVTVSAVIPNWEREKPRYLWDPSRRLLASIRGYQRCSRAGIFALVMRKFWALQHRFWSVICQAEIDLNCNIGGGLLLPHPNGVVIHPDVQIGPNCLFFQQVTLGSGKTPGVPRVGGHVDIGAGAKILGGVSLGDNCRVGANAVVLADVPEGATVAGVPARILKQP
jgi:serine O-acetyltransferase